MNTTSVSLLDRLRHAKPGAAEWRRVQDIYLPLIRPWMSRVTGLGDEADDLAEEALVALMQGKFRVLKRSSEESGELLERWTFSRDARARFVLPVRALRSDSLPAVRRFPPRSPSR